MNGYSEIQMILVRQRQSELRAEADAERKRTRIRREAERHGREPVGRRWRFPRPVLSDSRTG